MFADRLCPHRGVGQENTIASIRQGIAKNPFMVEFDTQYYDGNLYLGHPPNLNKETTLADALQLFDNALILPKIDLKVNFLDYERSLETLINQLENWNPRRALVNISDGLNIGNYMRAEAALMRRTDSNILLNIDLDRYKDKSDKQITEHLNNLPRRPFSLSPNLDDDIEASIDFAVRHGIPHIHFWAFHDRAYSLNFLYEVMDAALDQGLEVYFDIRLQNVARFYKLRLLKPAHA